MELVTLTDAEVNALEDALDTFDEARMGYRPEGRVRIGVRDGGQLVGGLDACMTAFHILYVSTVYVDEACRRRGIGRMLMAEMERQAAALGADMIRLDTFDWQGEAFYKALHYEPVGRYENAEDRFSETFFLKRLPRKADPIRPE